MSEVKVLQAQYKTVPSVDGAGPSYQYEALVSVFGNRDYAGDVVQPGAFAKSLANWEASGLPMPVYFAHRLDDPDMCIGKVLEAAEVLPGDPRLADATGVAAQNGGLWCKIQLDPRNKKALQVWNMIDDKVLNQSSFTYDVKEGSYVIPMANDDEESAPPSYFELTELDIMEVGPCPLGCNSATQVLATKTRQAAQRKAADPDDDPNTLIASIDATLDEASNLIAGIDLTTLPEEAQQAFALVVAAQAVVDSVMELLGIEDPDDAADKARPGLMAKAGRVLSSKNHADLKQAHELITGVLSSATAETVDDEEKTLDEPQVKVSDLTLFKLRQAEALGELDLYLMES